VTSFACLIQFSAKIDSFAVGGAGVAVTLNWLILYVRSYGKLCVKVY